MKLAAQTLSNSVAEALLFLSEDINLPDFENCQTTVKFIKIIDKVFDLTNSRLPWAKGQKSALRMGNELVWKKFIRDAVYYLANLKNIKNEYLWRTKRKTPFIGFIISLTSITYIFDDLIKEKKVMVYLLTYKFSQDHLELFFCAIR